MRLLTRSTLARQGTVIGALGLVAVLGLSGCSQGSSAAATADGPGGTGPSATAAPSTPSSPTSTPTTTGASRPSGTSPATDDQRVPAGGAAATTAPAALRPTHLRIAAIGVDTALGDLGVAADGSVEVPSNPSLAGWFDRGPAPGQQGPAVVLGHVDSLTGPAVFARLRELRTGDPIVVTRRDGSAVTFTVDAVQTVAKDRFPTAQTYGPVPGPALRLITCGGSYDHSRGGYQANVIVFAS
ncbi:class F sortase [Dermatophilaceae bacterium Soc4.6]